MNKDSLKLAMTVLERVTLDISQWEKWSNGLLFWDPRDVQGFVPQRKLTSVFSQRHFLQLTCQLVLCYFDVLKIYTD